MPTRVYLPGAGVSHALDDLHSPNQPNAALCGRTPSWPDLWHGTGSQDEEERAMDLRLCVGCETIIRERASGVLER